MVEKIRMNVNETLELEYLVEQISDGPIKVNEPTSGSSSINYISKNIGVFNPSETGIHKLTINGQTVEIDVTDIPDSTIFHTPIKTGSGSTVVDEIFGNDGTNNGASFISDSNAFDGFELEFDGTDTVNFGEPPELDLNSGPITIIATVTTTGTDGNQAIVAKTADASSRGYNFYIEADGRLGWYDTGGDVRSSSNTAVDDGEKHRLAGQQAADGSVTYYVDGVSDGTASGTGDFDSGSDVLYGNRVAGGWSLDGNLDNVIITDDLLTESQIESDFNSQPWS